MLLKNLPADQVVGKIVLRLFMDALAFVNMAMRGQVIAAFAIIKAHWSFFLSLKKWLDKRREIQNQIVQHTTTGIYPKSIVYGYFFEGKRKFSELNWNPHNKG